MALTVEKIKNQRLSLTIRALSVCKGRALSGYKKEKLCICSGDAVRCAFKITHCTFSVQGGAVSDPI